MRRMEMEINAEKLPLTCPILLAKAITDNKYKSPNHIKYLERNILQALAQGKARVIINMPPRHGKSELLSKYLPAWYLLNFPDNRIILTSYEATFAQSWSRKIRDIIAEYGTALNGITLDPNNSGVSGFSIAGHSGGLQSAGAGGAITGKGADLVIIDDPIKNDAEANSPTIRENIWEWFRSTVFTRLEPSGSILLIMTRWHEDDLCGRIIKELNESGEWQIISLAAIAELNCPLGLQKGEALWEARFTAIQLENIRKNIGNYWFESLYQQRPAQAEGGIFKKSDFRYYKYSGKDIIIKRSDENKVISFLDLQIFITVDLAASTKDTADYTVLMVFAVNAESDVFILEIIRNRFDTLRHLELIRDAYNKWHPVLIGIESVQYQYSLVRSAANEGLPVKALRPNADKLTRSLPMQAKMNNGKVYMPEYAAWLADFEQELLSFPNAKHDDQVDCFAYINELILPNSGGALPIGRKK